MAHAINKVTLRVAPAQPLPKGRSTIVFGLRCAPWKGHARAGPASAASAVGLPSGPRLAKNDCDAAERYLINRMDHQDMTDTGELVVRI